jgi:hypothetical protein
MGLTRNI